MWKYKACSLPPREDNYKTEFKLCQFDIMFFLVQNRNGSKTENSAVAICLHDNGVQRMESNQILIHFSSNLKAAILYTSANSLLGIQWSCQIMFKEM